MPDTNKPKLAHLSVLHGYDIYYDRTRAVCVKDGEVCHEESGGEGHPFPAAIAWAKAQGGAKPKAKPKPKTKPSAPRKPSDEDK